jgi:Ca2+-binding EF-hand superfamily protein
LESFESLPSVRVGTYHILVGTKVGKKFQLKLCVCVVNYSITINYLLINNSVAVEVEVNIVPYSTINNVLLQLLQTSTDNHNEMTSRRKRKSKTSTKELSLQPHVSSVVPREICQKDMSTVMKQSINKASVGLLENFIVSGWEGSSRPNSSSHVHPKNHRLVIPHNRNSTRIHGKIPTKPPERRSVTTSSTSTKKPDYYGEPVLKNDNNNAELVKEPSVITPETGSFDSVPTPAPAPAPAPAPTRIAARATTASAAAKLAVASVNESLSNANVPAILELQRPLPQFRMPSHDRSIQVLTIQYQHQLKQQGIIMSKEIRRMKRTHEVDLANVVLAYDTRIDTLENKITTHKSNNLKLNAMVKQLKHVLTSQRADIAKMKAKIKLQETQSPRAMAAKMLGNVSRNSSSMQHRIPSSLKGTPPHTQPSMWHSNLGDPSNMDGVVSDGGRNEVGQGRGLYDRHGYHDSDSDSGSDDGRSVSNSGGRRSFSAGGSEDETTEILRMREEIQQYQEALAEASKTIELLENNNSEHAAANVVAAGDTDELQVTVKMYEKNAARTQEELQTEIRIRKRVEAQYERERSKSDQLEEENKKLQAMAGKMRVECDRIRQDVAKNEVRINTKLKGAAIQMKQTLKQCHMLKELVLPEITCKNCFEVLVDAQILYPCGHSFCDKCVDQMERPEDGMIKCQVCQSLVPRADTCPNASLQAICPRVSWWAEPISALKDMFNSFDGKEFVAQQTFADSDPSSPPPATTRTATSHTLPTIDARTTKVLVRIAGAVKETGKSVVELFEEFDDDHGGTVDYKELKRGLEGIHLFLSPTDFDALLAYADPNGDGEIEYHEFAELLDHMFTMREGRDHAMKRHSLSLDPMVSSARNKGY